LAEAHTLHRASSDRVVHKLGGELDAPYRIGRKNWLHIGSKEAGPKIAAIFSIVESCRKLNIPIRQYLLHVLPGLADRSIQSLAELTPAAYSAKMAS